MVYNRKTIQNNFIYHKPKGDQPERYEKIRLSAKMLADVFLRLTPDSAEKTLAFRKLEEAVMWANASIARNE